MVAWGKLPRPTPVEHRVPDRGAVWKRAGHWQRGKCFRSAHLPRADTLGFLAARDWLPARRHACRGGLKRDYYWGRKNPKYEGLRHRHKRGLAANLLAKR